ncbi:MAG: hypothetical protein BAJATHORv1_60064 [Candidatus Thorarchaeota archaeon]|nr:MAG: hypothetical protein BAJATHORv1_60064 [Candidatus Thorarchaeota archaeon]
MDVAEMSDIPEVSAPVQWMRGWNKHLNSILKASDEDLLSQPIGHVTQQLSRALFVADVEPEGMDVLEIACGDGRTSCHMAKLGCKVQAFDAIPTALEVSRRRAELMEVSENTIFELSTMEEFQLESYDIVIALQCIQYLFDEAISKLKEIRDSIRPGGFVAYSGNIPPHFETEPKIRFINPNELKEIFDGWTVHSYGTEETLLKPDDLRGYVWLVARKSTN